MRAKKYLLTLFILMFLASMAKVSIPATASPTVTFKVDPLITTGAPVGSEVKINVSIVADPGAAVVAWAVNITVDPDVLKPGFWKTFPVPHWKVISTSQAGYFLYDWCVATGWDPDPGSSPTQIKTGSMNQTAGTITGYSESIKDWYELLNQPGNGTDGTGTVATFHFTSLNETAWSPIEITAAYYWDSWEIPAPKRTADAAIPGNYNSPPGGDVAVINVVPSVSEAYSTWTVQVNVTVFNNGTIPINYTVADYYNASTWVQIGTQNATNLTARQHTTLTFNWSLAGVPYHNRTIKANATIIGLDDMNSGDNEFVVYDAVKVKMAGDVDGNNYVGSGDVFELAGAYGEHLGDEYWNRQCDFDDDGYVGSMDLFILVPNYGESY